MNRLERWLVYRAILGRLKALYKEGSRMKPLPKWLGVLGAIIGAAPAIYAAYQTGGTWGAIMAIVTILGGGTAVMSHSLTGSGGKQ